MRYGAYLPAKLLEAVQPQLEYMFMEPDPSPTYIAYYKKAYGFKFLDNGLIEFGRAWKTGDIYDYAKSVNAEVVCSPDMLGNWPFNKAYAVQMADLWPRQRVAVTLAGPSPLQFYLQAFWCYVQGFKYVCLPYRMNRVPVPFAEHTHLFGFRKPERYADYNATATIDTVEPINAALRGWSYANNGFASFQRIPNYATHHCPQDAVDKALANIKWFKGEVLSANQSKSSRNISRLSA